MALVSLCAMSCGNGSQKGESLTDSIVDSAVIAENVIVRMLPDTVYPSASKVKFDIQIPDTTIDGTLEAIEDLYEAVSGALTFRGGGRRDAAFGGVLDSVPTKINVDWHFITDED